MIFFGDIIMEVFLWKIKKCEMSVEYNMDEMKKSLKNFERNRML